MSAVHRSASRHLVAAAMGYGADRLLGELPDQLHPLRAFGALMGAIEAHTYRDTRRAGAAYAATGITAGWFAGSCLRSTAAATYLSCGGRALTTAAGEVDGALGRGDLVSARLAAKSLVGRDLEQLDEKELVRAAIESVAENTVDALIAPILFAAAAGGRGVLVHRALNTMDALVGYRTARYEAFGWASARLDDLANYVPARFTAVLVALVRPQRAREILRTVCRDARHHPSPNAGVAESAFAAALGVRLGGVNSYGGVLEARREMGDGRLPERGDIVRATRLSRDVGVSAACVALLAGLSLCYWTSRRSGPGRRP